MAATTTGSKLETRLVLLIGMVFIVAFGVVLSEVAQNDSERGKTVAVNIPAPAAKVVPPGPDCPVMDDPSPPIARVNNTTAREPAVAPLPAVAPPAPSETVAVRLIPPSSDDLRIAMPAPADARVAVADPRVADARRDLAAGAASRPASPDVPVTLVAAAAPGVKYVVQPKDSFIKIAKKFYGENKAMEYKKIQEANKALLGNKNILTAGMELVIPDLPGSPARAVAGSAVAAGTPSRTAPAAPAAPVAAPTAGSPAGTVAVAMGPSTPARATPATMPSGGSAVARVPVMTVDEMRRAFGADTGPSAPPAGGAVIASAGRTAVATGTPAGRSVGSAGSTPAGTPVSTASMGAGASAGAAATPRAKTYVVKPGDSLAKIARLYLRDDSAAAVQKLYQANKDKMSSPNSLVVGRAITIPS